MIIEAIVEKVLSKSITEIPGTVESLARCVTTDYSVTDLVSLALTFKDKGLTMYSAACPSYTLNQDGISYVGTQYAEWQDMMRRVDAGLDPTDTSAEIPEPRQAIPNWRRHQRRLPRRVPRPHGRRPHHRRRRGRGVGTNPHQKRRAGPDTRPGRSFLQDQRQPSNSCRKFIHLPSHGRVGPDATPSRD